MNGEDYKSANAGYERGNAILDEVSARLAAQAQSVYRDGVNCPGIGKLHFVWVALEGDLPAQARSLHCKRNLNCMPNQLCPWCLADDLEVPFSDFRPVAAWRRTVGASRPWTTESPMLGIAGAEHEVFLAKDLFHLCHLGAEGNNIPDKLSWAYREFKRFCVQRNATPMVKHFTKENLGWSSLNSYPQCSFKGSDTRLILGFVLQTMRNPRVALDDIASEALLAASAMDDFLRLIFGLKDNTGCKQALLSVQEGSRALMLLKTWIQKFYSCARLCFDRNLRFFSLTPKYHFLLHVALDVEQQLSDCEREGGQFILNPGLFATQMAEDATGRSSRISRTVHVRTTALRVAQRLANHLQK
eukprot:s1930_g6.t1